MKSLIPKKAKVVTESKVDMECYCYTCRNYRKHVQTTQEFDTGHKKAWQTCNTCKTAQHAVEWRYRT